MTLGGDIPEEKPAQDRATGITGPVRGGQARTGRVPPSSPSPGKPPAQSRIAGQRATTPGAPAAVSARHPGKECPKFSDQPDMPDHTILKQTLAAGGPAADREMAYFYSLLFTASPQLRAMFPLAMDEQRRALSAALARCVWSMDNPQSLHEHLAQLGRDHRGRRHAGPACPGHSGRAGQHGPGARHRGGRHRAGRARPGRHGRRPRLGPRHPVHRGRHRLRTHEGGRQASTCTATRTLMPRPGSAPEQALAQTFRHFGTQAPSWTS
jgi:hypothetical protein